MAAAGQAALSVALDAQIREMWALLNDDRRHIRTCDLDGLAGAAAYFRRQAIIHAFTLRCLLAVRRDAKRSGEAA